MSRLVWHAVGERTFEVGVDRGVLYIQGSPGVPWIGLIAVNEQPVGGDVTPYYLDGIKYINHVANEEFEATIEAYTYPEEFAQCDGTLSVANGLFATQQPKKSFGLSYRTKVGNDVDGIDHAYKIHLVYNATAAPTQKANNSLSNEIDPFNFNWAIFTRPPTMQGVKPTAHFIIDSRDVPIDLLKTVEDILYGSADNNPRLPSVPELQFIFGEYQTSVFDAGFLTDTYFNEFDAGVVPEPQTSTIDGGSP